MLELCRLLHFGALGAKLHFSVGCDECETITFDKFDWGYSFASSSLHGIISELETLAFNSCLTYYLFCYLECEALRSLSFRLFLRKRHYSSGNVILNRWYNRLRMGRI